MTSKKSRLSLIAMPMLFVAGPAVAGPAEPVLVETKLPDPDPGFVPPPPEKRGAHRRRNAEENPTLDEAMENLGRVVGQAAQMAEQNAKSRAAEAQARAAAHRAEIDAAIERAKGNAASRPE